MKRLSVLVVLGAFLNCVPTYNDGDTLCSPSRECPSGYVCGSNNYCYLTNSPCMPSASDTTCGGCIKANCCHELTDCDYNSACVSIASCESSCTTSSCLSTCESNYSGGATSFNNYMVCADNYCTAACVSTGGSGGSGGSSGGSGGKSGSIVSGGSSGSNGGAVGGSSTSSTGSTSSSSVSFSYGKASGAINGYAWVALGAQDTLTSPTCDNSIAGGSTSTPITSTSPCMNVTSWSSSNALCISGTIPAVVGGDYDNNWGIQIGVNSSQPPATSTAYTLGKSYAKVTFSLTGTVTPTNTAIRGMLHRLGDADTTTYCATIRSGTAVSITAFNTACWDGTGTSLTAADVPHIDKVGVQVSSDVSNAYTISNFCLTGIAFQ